LYGLLDNCIEEFAATEVVLGCAHGFYDPDQEGIEIWENVPHSKAALVKLDEKSELAELAEVELDIQYSHLGKGHSQDGMQMLLHSPLQSRSGGHS
jgi:hypothetical protein